MTPPARSLFRFLASSNADNLPLALWLTSTPATHSHTTRQCCCDECHCPLRWELLAIWDLLSSCSSPHPNFDKCLHSFSTARITIAWRKSLIDKQALIKQQASMGGDMVRDQGR